MFRRQPDRSESDSIRNCHKKTSKPTNLLQKDPIHLRIYVPRQTMTPLHGLFPHTSFITEFVISLFIIKFVQLSTFSLVLFTLYYTLTGVVYLYCFSHIFPLYSLLFHSTSFLFALFYHNFELTGGRGFFGGAFGNYVTVYDRDCCSHLFVLYGATSWHFWHF